MKNCRLPVIIGMYAILLATATHGAVAASTANFRLRADMLPVSCDVLLSNGGVVDFGTISAGHLSNSAFTSVGTGFVSLTLTCDAAAKVALTAVDGRKGTAVAGIGKFLFPNQNDAATFGVGSVDGKQVGAYILYREDAPTADGAAARSIVSNDDGATWAVSSGANNAITPNARLHGWAPASGTVAPGSFTSVTQRYKIRLGLNKKTGLPPVAQEIPIDGLATFTVTYL